MSNQTAEIFLKNRFRQIFNAHLFFNFPKNQKLKIDHRAEGNNREIIFPDQKIQIIQAAKRNSGKIRLIIQILHQCAPRGSEIVHLKKSHLEFIIF